MNELRHRLILIFLAATLVPLAATLWMTTSLLDRSLSYASTTELDHLSKSLEHTGREYYQQACESLKAAAISGKLAGQTVSPAPPDELADFRHSGESERFILTGEDGRRLEYLVRHGDQVLVYAKDLGVGMRQLSAQYKAARALVSQTRVRDLRRGFTYTYVLLMSAVWLTSLTALVIMARQISRPIRRLTAGLSQLAGGDFETRIESSRRDEIGRAIQAFNHTAAQLRHNRERLIHLTQLASWQVLARKMAHEIKNSLTPIRLTVEEMLARHPGPDRGFLEQAAQIVIEEIESLERRVRAFSQFSAEPPVEPVPVDMNALLEDRVAFLRMGHPEVSYIVRAAEAMPAALADEDLVKGILTNLLENAAEAAGNGGRILAEIKAEEGRVAVEIHDSGPGLSEQARASLFQPTISFKKRGMGLGLSIARKSALLLGGDIVPVAGELGGAGFRVVLPVFSNAQQETAHS